METTKKTNVGLTYGLICGLVSVVFGLILYLGGVKWFVNPIAYVGIVIPIVIAVLAGVKQKKMQGGYLEFSEALKTVFTVFVIGTLVGTAFNYILFNFIDVPFAQALTQESAEKTQEWMQKFGASQNDIDQATEKILKGDNYSLGKQALNAAFVCIFWFVVSLIIAAIIKRKKPAFPTVSQ